VTTYARIVSGCLMLRTVYWLLVEWRYYLNLPKYEVKICPHLSATQDNLPEDQRHHPFIDLSQPGPYAYWSIRRVAGYHLNQCHLCSTEFEMDGTECGRNLFAFRTSVWQDFGDCSSLYDPNASMIERGIAIEHPSVRPAHLGASKQNLKNLDLILRSSRSWIFQKIYT
jgi:hypothetical protein